MSPGWYQCIITKAFSFWKHMDMKNKLSNHLILVHARSAQRVRSFIFIYYCPSEAFMKVILRQVPFSACVNKWHPTSYNPVTADRVLELRSPKPYLTFFIRNEMLAAWSFCCFIPLLQFGWWEEEHSHRESYFPDVYYFSELFLPLDEKHTVKLKETYIACPSIFLIHRTSLNLAISNNMFTKYF